MKIDDIKRIAVIGAGSMGGQIAEIFSRVGGYEVSITDISEQFVNKGIKVIDDRIERFFVAKGKLTAEEKKKIMGRIKGATSIEAVTKDVDFVIEAVLENLPLKKEIFKKLVENAPKHAILASNTSYQNISEMASVTKRPELVLGMHFFNPVAMMQLVEVVKNPRTSKEAIEVTYALARKLGKEPVACGDSSYGFLANRVYRPLQVEAVQMLAERVASPSDIDKAAKLGYNLPMGPLELGDMVGSWKIWADSEQDTMKELGPENGHLHPLLRMMLRAGYFKIYQFWDEVLSKW